MMWKYYNPTATERRAIEAGYDVLERIICDDYSLQKFIKAERKGYGFYADKIPLIATKAFMCKWFLDGVNSPKMPAADIWNIRPAAIFATGNGIEKHHKVNKESKLILKLAVEAHKNAFDRHMNRQIEGIN